MNVYIYMYKMGILFIYVLLLALYAKVDTTERVYLTNAWKCSLILLTAILYMPA